jgi:hypothetical protein
LVGVQATLRRVGRNGSPRSPIHRAPLEAALAEFVAGLAELEYWVSEDGVYWHAALLWTAGIPWEPVASLSTRLYPTCPPAQPLSRVVRRRERIPL